MERGQDGEMERWTAGFDHAQALAEVVSPNSWDICFELRNVGRLDRETPEAVWLPCSYGRGKARRAACVVQRERQIWCRKKKRGLTWLVWVQYLGRYAGIGL